MNEEQARASFEHALDSYRQEFNTFFLARLFGMEMTYTADTCIVTMPVHDFMFNPQGSLHGGVTATALDIAMGHLLKHAAGAGATLSFNIQYVKGVREGQLRTVGQFVRRGKSICFLRADAYDASGDLIASASSTWKLIDKK